MAVTVGCGVCGYVREGEQVDVFVHPPDEIRKWRLKSGKKLDWSQWRHTGESPQMTLEGVP